MLSDRATLKKLHGSDETLQAADAFLEPPNGRAKFALEFARQVREGRDASREESDLVVCLAVTIRTYLAPKGG
jgi:hypothetical protein